MIKTSRITLLLFTLFAILPGGMLADSHAQLPSFSTSQRLEYRISPRGCLEMVTTVATRQYIMGYTDKEVPGEIPIPINLQRWQQCVEQAAEIVNEHPEVQMGTSTRDATVIQPLLGDIAWDQTGYFTYYCPSKCPTGCVATAMAQIMYYYRYPAHGTGQHSYRYNGRVLSADFGATTYDWDKMFDYLHRDITPAQEKAVSLLSYHCGIAVDMNYTEAGSGSYVESVPYAMTTYFGYNSRMGIVYRNCYRYEEWSQLITDELKEGRPVLFSAENSEIGHAFVIDGRNAEGLYHVNWGWGGYYNGYYDIGILDPEGAGTGGTKAQLGYCLNQSAIINISPLEGVGREVCPIGCRLYFAHEDKTSHNKVITATFENHSNYMPIGTVCLDIVDSQGNVCLRCPSEEYTFAQFGEYGSAIQDDYELTAERLNQLNDGHYRVCLGFMPKGQDGKTMYIDCSRLCNNIEFNVRDHQLSGLETVSQLNQFRVDRYNLAGQQQMATGRKTVFKFDVMNITSESFYGYFSLVFSRMNNGKREQFNFDTAPVKMNPDECESISIPVTISKDGEWETLLYAYDYAINGVSSVEVPDFGSMITVQSEDSPAVLRLIDGPELLTPRCEVNGEISIRLKVDNIGANFDSQVAIHLFSLKTATTAPKYIIAQKAQIAEGATGQELIISGQLTDIKGNTKYYARPFYMDYNDEYQPIVDAEGTVIPIQISVYNSSAIEEVNADDDGDKAPIYDLMGRCHTRHDTSGIRIHKGKISYHDAGRL